MRCIVIANGVVTNYKRLFNMIDDDDYLICADGGLKHALKMGLIPDVLIGDLDSVDDNDVEKLGNSPIEIIRFVAEKDETDTELAVLHGISKNPTEIILMGVTGGRLDHTLANLGVLKEIHDKGIKVRSVSEFNEIYITNNRLEVTGAKGDLVSVIPITETVEGVTLEGLQYPLTNKTLDFGAPIGISNVFLGRKAIISVSKGYVLVMKAYA